MPLSLHEYEIPVPEDSALLAEYKALGWYRLDDPPRLKWSFARGTPRHPGEEPPSPPRNELLDSWLVRDLVRMAPLAYHHDGDSFEVRALVTVKLQKVVTRHPRGKSWPSLKSWEVVDAEMTVQPPEASGS